MIGSDGANSIVVVITPEHDEHHQSPPDYQYGAYNYWTHHTNDFRIFANSRNAKRGRGKNDRVFILEFDPNDPTPNALKAIEVP